MQINKCKFNKLQLSLFSCAALNISELYVVSTTFL